MKAVKRRVSIRSHLRRGRRVKHHSRNIIIKKRGIISHPHRKIFTDMSSDPIKVEYGGLIDFGKNGKIERFTADIGHPTYVDRKISEDFEVLWHSHPGGQREMILPSPTDLAALAKEKEQQAEVIFNKGNVFGIAKTKRIKQIQNKSMRQLEDYFMKRYMTAERKAIDKGKFNVDKYIHAFTEGLEDDGFVVFKAPANKREVTIPIRVKEPAAK